mgnify:CR=1 FL=1
MATVQNASSEAVENQSKIKLVKDVNIEKIVQEICDKVLNLKDFDVFCEILTNNIDLDLKQKSFMTINLDLTKAQKEELEQNLYNMILSSKKEYLKGINENEETKEKIKIIKDNLMQFCDILLGAVAKEINRGVAISCTAVGADTKNKDYNKIELNYGKYGYDITIPSNGVFISTNCIEAIRYSVEGCAINTTYTEVKSIEDDNNLDSNEE